MKKLLLLITAVVFATTVSAQDKKLLEWGVEAGLNINSLSFNKDVLASSNRAGFFVGPKVKVNVPLLGFGLDGALIYSMNSAAYNDVTNNVEKSESFSYLEVPINLRYSFGLKALKIYAATGPQFNYCLSSENTLNDFFAIATGQGDMSRSTWGWNVGAGVELFSHLQVGVTYTIPISDSGNFEWSHLQNLAPNFKQKTIKVRLAYFF